MTAYCCTRQPVAAAVMLVQHLPTVDERPRALGGAAMGWIEHLGLNVPDAEPALA